MCTEIHTTFSQPSLLQPATSARLPANTKANSANFIALAVKECDAGVPDFLVFLGYVG